MIPVSNARYFALITVAVLGAGFPGLRLAHSIAWPWPLVLSPLLAALVILAYAVLALDWPYRGARRTR